MDYKLIAKRDDSLTLLQQILLNRGIKQENIQHYLLCDENDDLDPMLLDHMKEGASLLAKHISLNSKALIVVDADCDGFCSSAIFMNYFNLHFPSWIQNKVDYFIHQGKQHGLDDVIKESNWIEKGYKLIILPDAASNDYVFHRVLRQNGVDCLILDHHETDGGYSPDAVTINNQLSENYPTKSLCGGAVVYKFCRYFDKLMHTDCALRFRDLVALSLVGDMMDLRDIETHFLVKDGLQRINNPFFVEMMNRQAYQLTNNLTPIGIAFYIVPYINAMTRSGEMEEKTLMFEAMLEWLSDLLIPSTKRGCKGQVETRHEQAGRTCINVKSRQKKVQDEGLAYIESIIEDENLLDNKLLVVRVPEDKVDKNLAGLIANQLAAKYARPTLVLRITKDGSGKIVYAGSARNYGKSRLENFRQFLLDTELVQYAQGHASAFGVAIEEENFETFIEKTNELLADFDFTPCYYVDLELNGELLQSNDIFEIASNNDIWGQGMDEPLIAITDLVVNKNNLAFIGQNNKTLRINLPNKKISMIKFNINDEDKLMLDPEDGTLSLTIIGKCALNNFNGNQLPQIMIEDFEINRRIKWDF